MGHDIPKICVDVVRTGGDPYLIPECRQALVTVAKAEHEKYWQGVRDQFDDGPKLFADNYTGNLKPIVVKIYERVNGERMYVIPAEKSASGLPIILGVGSMEMVIERTLLRTPSIAISAGGLIAFALETLGMAFGIGLATSARPEAQQQNFQLIREAEPREVRMTVFYAKSADSELPPMLGANPLKEKVVRRLRTADIGEALRRKHDQAPKGPRGPQDRSNRHKLAEGLFANESEFRGQIQDPAQRSFGFVITRNGRGDYNIHITPGHTSEERVTRDLQGCEIISTGRVSFRNGRPKISVKARGTKESIPGKPGTQWANFLETRALFGRLMPRGVSFDIGRAPPPPPELRNLR